MAFSTMYRLLDSYRFMLALSLLLWLASSVQLIRTLQDPRGLARIEESLSDLLAPTAQYYDLFIDHHPIKGFQFSAATFTFPDGLLCFFWLSVCPNVSTALFFWFFSLLFLLGMAAIYALWPWLPCDSRKWLIPGVLLIGAIYQFGIAIPFLETATGQDWLPLFHTGAQISTLLAWGMVGRLRDAQSQWRVAQSLGSLCLLCAVTIFSDRIFGLYFLMPAFCTWGLLKLSSHLSSAIVAPLSWRQFGLALAACGLGTLLGLFLGKYIPNPGGGNPMAGYFSTLQLDRFLPRLLIQIQQLRNEFAAGDLLLWGCVASIGLMIWQVKYESVSSIVLQCLLASWIGIIVTDAIVILGPVGMMYIESDPGQWLWYSRYFLSGQQTLLLLWVVPFTSSPRIRLACVALVLGLLVWTIVVPRKPSVDLGNYQPRYVQMLDAYAEKHLLNAGFSAYWECKPIRYFSKRRLAASQIHQTNDAEAGAFTPHMWLCNSAWFFPQDEKGLAILPQWVLCREKPRHENDVHFSSKAVIASFGEPDQIYRDGNYTLLVYQDPKHEMLQRFCYRQPYAVWLKRNLGR
jgi:hypothetical protein